VILYRFLHTRQGTSSQPAQQPAETSNPPVVADTYVARLEAELKKAKK